MIYLSPKKPPFEKTTLSNDKTKISFNEKKPWTIFRTFDQNHGNMQNFQLYIKMTFLSSKKAPSEKTTSSNDKWHGFRSDVIKLYSQNS